ncbi:hypothetical protein MBEBAB_2869 [Brevundimonas abyssalis TAR-001]|uniref:Uncharacterized protein n=1 Tax=Brevundimonas abyssalis TAR-001 TaxID=1391729 RepID=A0A8E0NE44_9CAUL|nr:hypothetical protein MBEBAB_2869 [Brevundimonas abyssalis TAR-001]
MRSSAVFARKAMHSNKKAADPAAAAPRSVVRRPSITM